MQGKMRPDEMHSNLFEWTNIHSNCVFYPRVALDRAAVLLTMKREMVRLDNVWGVGGGLRPVKHLVKEVSNKNTKQ